MTRVFCILGYPVGHSRSPAMHRAAFEATGIDAVYVPFEVPPARLPEAIAGVRALGIAGGNVTLPHKEAVLSLLDEVEDDARAIGAVNTIVRERERLVGTNTDAPGLVAALVEAGCDPRGRTCVVLGTGGAARAAVVGLARAGASAVRVWGRHEERAHRLVESVAATAAAASVTPDLRRAFDHADLVIQATSATLENSPTAESFAAALPWDALPPHAVVNDLVYEPRETTVLRAARTRGLRTVDGLAMLAHQGALAFSRWTGVDAPLPVMRQVSDRR